LFFFFFMQFADCVAFPSAIQNADEDQALEIHHLGDSNSREVPLAPNFDDRRQYERIDLLLLSP